MKPLTKLSGARFISLIVAFAAVSLTSLAQTIQFYGVDKRVTYLQNSSSTPSTPSATINDPNGPYFFEANISGSSLNLLGSAPTLTGSYPASSLTLVLKNSNTQYGFSGNNPAQHGFSTKPAMDTAFPDTTYTLNNLPVSVALALGASDAYPTDIPHITNGSWSAGALQVNAATGITLSFSSLSNYSVGLGGFIAFGLYTTSGGNIGSQIADVFTTFTSSDPAQTTFTINPGDLTAGQTYFGELSFGKYITADNSSVSGALGYAFFENMTGFSITAVPEPSAFALGAGMVALLGASLYRRRQQPTRP